MENPISISWLNDFIFCPASIYYHELYSSMEKMIYQDTPQIAGTISHSAIDESRYSSRKDVLQGMAVYSEKYNLIGKIDVYDMQNKVLIEKKRKIKTIYDGYIFQLYAQYFCLIEMGYEIQKIQLYSMDDNKTYCVDLPENNVEMFNKFEEIIKSISEFQIMKFTSKNIQKCENCIYEPICDKSLV